MARALRITEHQIQVAFMQWWRWEYQCSPLCYANVNAARRSYALAAYMRAEGLTAGIPDLTIAVARGNYHGMYLELKKPKQKPTAAQFEMLQRLNAEGYYAVWADSLEAAIALTRGYLGNWRPASGSALRFSAATDLTDPLPALSPLFRVPVAG